MQPSVDELKRAIDLLHKEGQIAWMRLCTWRKVTNWLAGRPDIFQASPPFWQMVNSSLFEQAAMGLARLVDPRKGGGSITVRYLLNGARAAAGKPIWGKPPGSLARDRVLKIVDLDLADLDALSARCKGILAWRDKVQAHLDNVHLSDPGYTDSLSRIPSSMRDVLFELSRIVNQYDGLLNDRVTLWNTDDLGRFEGVGHLLELGFDARKALLDACDLDALDNDWSNQGRIVPPPAKIAAEIAVNEWKWDWLEHYQREFHRWSRS